MLFIWAAPIPFLVTIGVPSLRPLATAMRRRSGESRRAGATTTSTAEEGIDPDWIPSIIGGVGLFGQAADHDVAGRVLEAGLQRSALALVALVQQRVDLIVLLRHLGHQLAAAVDGAVVDHDDLLGDRHVTDPADHGLEGLDLVVDRNHHGQQELAPGFGFGSCGGLGHRRQDLALSVESCWAL